MGLQTKVQDKGEIVINNVYFQLLLSFDPDIQISTKSKRRFQLLRRIQSRRCRVIQFIGDNAFVSHHSSLFVYHQLKSLVELLQLAHNLADSQQAFQNIERDLDALDCEFIQWLTFAKKVELAQPPSIESVREK